MLLQTERTVYCVVTYFFFFDRKKSGKKTIDVLCCIQEIAVMLCIMLICQNTIQYLIVMSTNQNLSYNKKGKPCCVLTFKVYQKGMKHKDCLPLSGG